MNCQGRGFELPRRGSCRGKEAETRTVIFSEGVFFFLCELAGDGAHRHIDVIGARVVSEFLQLSQDVVRVLSRKRRRSRAIGNGAVARLTGRYAALAVSGRDQSGRQSYMCR